MTRDEAIKSIDSMESISDGGVLYCNTLGVEELIHEIYNNLGEERMQNNEFKQGDKVYKIELPHTYLDNEKSLDTIELEFVCEYGDNVIVKFEDKVYELKKDVLLSKCDASTILSAKKRLEQAKEELQELLRTAYKKIQNESKT